MQNHSKSKKRESIQILEYSAFWSVAFFARVLPLKVLRGISHLLGDLMYLLFPRRRSIAIENLHRAFDGTKSARDIRYLALQSCRSFFLTAAETLKFHFSGFDVRLLVEQGYTLQEMQTLKALFQKAKRIHKEFGGCIFVTPHIGNWEVLLQVSVSLGIPLAVVVRPLDNAYIENLLYKNRTSGGQILVPKKNAWFMLQSVLRQGKSIAMLPDQSTKKGLSVDFFGNKALTTPIPALLAVIHRKPIVVVACCRGGSDRHFTGYVSDPIEAGEYKSEKAEIIRLTQEMNREMEKIIREFPEQYLWVHKRWKTYETKKELFA